MNSQPISVPHKRAGRRARRRRVHELVELDAALVVAHGDHRVADIDQIFALHPEDAVAYFFGLLLVVEGNENQIAHDVPPLQTAARPDRIAPRNFCFSFLLTTSA